MSLWLNSNLRLSFLWLALIIGSSGSVMAHPRVVVLMVPGLTAADVAAAESAVLQQTVNAASGWMLCRAARTSERREGFAAQCLTLGSGSRAAVPADLPLSVITSGKGANLSPATLARVRAANANLDHSVSIGAVGDVLHHAGQHTALVGARTDSSDDLAPFLFAMDSAGKVDFYQPRTTSPNPSAPYGIADDLVAIDAALQNLPGSVNLAVVVFGDLDRADRYASVCLPDIVAKHRQNARSTLNSLLASLLKHQNKSDRLVVLSPAPAESLTDRFDKITPLWISPVWDSHQLNGVLVSASTRRMGLVLNTDILPSLAKWLDLQVPQNVLGRPLGAKPRKQFDAAAWTGLHDKLTETARKQNAFGGLPTVQMFLVLGAVGAAWKRKMRLARALATGIFALPLLLLWLPLVAPASLSGSGILLAAALGLLMLLGTLCVSVSWLLCALLWASILFDLSMANSLLQSAWMSYSVMEGARFYGIGNEYMGAAIGALCAFWGLQPDTSRRAFGAYSFFFALLILLMGISSGGAKAGAIPSAGCALGVMMIVRQTGKFRLRHLMLLLGMVLLGLVLLALWDAHHATEGQSHFARAVSGSGGGTLLQIAWRKLTMEGTLLVRSPWSLTLWASALGFAFLRSRLPNASANVRVASSGIVAGAIASLLCNDAGVLASALILLSGTAFLCLVTTSEPKTPNQTESPVV